MKSRILLMLVLVILLSVLSAGAASAAGIPVGSCPPGFHEHATSDHHDGHMHKHIGNSFDQNGDGRVCVKHVTPDDSIHVHIDNRVR
jgi:hypothetical protein